MTAPVDTSGLMLSILAFDPAAQALGIALASSSVAVGSRCPYLAPGKAVVTSQGFTNLRMGALALDLVACGLTAAEAMDALRKHDRWMDYRQIAIVSAIGAVEAHTGPDTNGWSGHLVRSGLAVLGNGLPDPGPLYALSDRFQAQAGLPLAERLLQALEHARDVVGGRRTVASSSLLVRAPDEAGSVDLRVDLARAPPAEGGCAIADLRRLHDISQPLTALYIQRSRLPDLARTPERTP